MKLRNKKTGEVIILIDHTFDNYNSLAELCAEWEDYKPQEPRIKDEKIDYLKIKYLVKEAMQEAEEERVKRLAHYYAELSGEEEE